MKFAFKIQTLNIYMKEVVAILVGQYEAHASISGDTFKAGPNKSHTTNSSIIIRTTTNIL